MIRTAFPRATALAAWWLLASAALFPAAAQTAPPAPPPGPAPVVRFDPNGVGIDEAVRLALEHDPALQQAQTRIELQAGVVQEQGGLFDPSIFATVFTEYRLQELTESRKKTEREKRERQASALEQNAARAAEAQRVLAALNAVEAAPPGSQAQVDALAAVNASLGAQIRTFDALIAATTGATRQQLVDARAQYLADNINLTRNLLDQALRDRDDTARGLANLGEAPVDEVFYRTQFSLAWRKLFRSGISFGPFLEGGIEGTNFKDKPRSADFGGKGLEDTFTFRAGVDFLVPLMRGRGATAVAAQERAAILEQDAGQLDLAQERAITALETALAYWDLRGAQEGVDVATRSLGLQSRIAETTKALIDAGDVPGVELARAQAGEARARALVEDRQRRLREARVALARTMGLLATDEEATLPLARDTFPTLDELRVTVAVLDATIAQRPDLAAAAKREAASQVLQEGAVTELRPRLDLSGRTYFTALDEKRFANAVDRWVGPSIELTADFEKPIGNNRARGIVAQTQADVRSRRIAINDLNRQTRLRALRSVQVLPDAIERVRQAEAAVKLYGTTVQSEFERFRAGESTLIDTLITEQQLTEATLALVSARQEVAQLIAELRYESGTLLDNGNVSLPNLTTPPSGAGR